MVHKEREVVSAKKENICKLIREQEKKESEQMHEHDTAQQLIGEACNKLSLSLKNKDLSGANVAQMMLTTGNLKLQETSKELNIIREEKLKYTQKLAKLEQSQQSQTVTHDELEPPIKKKK